MKNEIDFLDYTPSQIRNLDRRKLKLEDKLSTVNTSKLIQFNNRAPKKCTSCEKENKLNTKIKKYLSGALLDPTMAMNVAKMQNSSSIANIQAGGNSPMTGAITSMIGPLANTLGNAIDGNKTKPNSLQQEQAAGDAAIGLASSVAGAIPGGAAVSAGLSAGNTLNKSITGDGTSGIRNSIAGLGAVGGFTNNLNAIASGRFEEAIPIYGSFVAADRRKKEIEEAKAREAKLAQDKMTQQQRQNVGAETLSLMSRDGSVSAQKGTKLKSYKNIDVNTDTEFIPQRYLSTEAEQNRIDENNVLINSANGGFGKTLEDTYQQRLQEAKQGKKDNLVDLGNGIVGFELQGKKYRLGEFKKKIKDSETSKTEQKSSDSKNIKKEEKLKTPEISQQAITPQVEKSPIIKSKPGPLDNVIQKYNDPSLIKDGKIIGDNENVIDKNISFDKYKNETFKNKETIWSKIPQKQIDIVQTVLFGLGNNKTGNYSEANKSDFLKSIKRRLIQQNLFSDKNDLNVNLIEQGKYSDLYEILDETGKSYGNIKLPKMKKESYRQGSKLNTSNIYRQGVSKSLKGFNNIKVGLLQQGAKLESNRNNNTNNINKHYNELGVPITPEEETDIETLFTQNPNLVADDNKLKAYQELHKQMGSPKIMLKENISNPFYEPNTKVIYIPKSSNAKAINDYLEELLHHNQNIQGQLTSKGLLGKEPNLNVNSPVYRQEHFDKASKANQAMVSDFDIIMKDLTGKAYNTNNLPLTSQTLDNLKQYRLNKNRASYYANPKYEHPENIHIQSKGKPFNMELKELENKFKLESENKKKNKVKMASKN